METKSLTLMEFVVLNKNILTVQIIIEQSQVNNLKHRFKLHRKSIILLAHYFSFNVFEASTFNILVTFLNFLNDSSIELLIPDSSTQQNANAKPMPKLHK